MDVKVFNNTSEIVNYYINLFSESKITGVDMTVGNGNDIFNMIKVIGKGSKLYGFDINPIAINNTTDKIKNIDNIDINIIKDSHDNLSRYITEAIDLAIYNLGYLPSGDKKTTTDYKTVIKSIKAILNLLKLNGIILITFYPGHKSGKLESIKIEEFLNELNQKEFNVLKFSFINQINKPPYIIVIERLK